MDRHGLIRQAIYSWLVGCLCLPSHRERAHLETAYPFTLPCKIVKLGFYTIPIGNRTIGHHVAVHYTTAAPRQLHIYSCVCDITYVYVLLSLGSLYGLIASFILYELQENTRSGLTQDNKMGICVFQFDVPHQWLAKRQVGPVSVYCDGVGCHVLCLRHGISVWQHIGQSTTATSRHRRDMTSDV